MYLRLKDIPVLDSYTSSIPAAVWNLWRRAWSRKRQSLFFGLTALPPMMILLEAREWVLMDASLNDMPVLAWGEFEYRGRALDAPVRCQVRQYHFGGARLRPLALAAIGDELKQRLK